MKEINIGVKKKKFTIYKKVGKRIIQKTIYGFLLSDFNFYLKIQEENWKIHRIKNYENSIEENVENSQNNIDFKA